MEQLYQAEFDIEDFAAESPVTLGNFTTDRNIDLLVDVNFLTFGMAGAYMDLSVYVDGSRFVPWPASTFDTSNTATVNYTRFRCRTRVGPVVGGETVTVIAQCYEMIAATGIVTLFDLGVMSQLNQAMPDDRAAGSPLDDLRRCRAFLANKTIQTLDSGVIVVKDNDNATTLFTLTPGESGGDLTVTPS